MSDVKEMNIILKSIIKEVMLYEESIKNNFNLLKENLIQRLQLLVNDASEDLIKVKDLNEKRKLREEISGHLKEMNILIKSILKEDDKKCLI